MAGEAVEQRARAPSYQSASPGWRQRAETSVASTRSLVSFSVV